MGPEALYAYLTGKSSSLRILRQLAYLTGINNSGTRPQISSRLLQEVYRNTTSSLDVAQTQSQHAGKTLNPRHASYRVLSIDMGVRNLAYCMLEFQSSKSYKQSKVQSRPIIKEWNCLSVDSISRTVPNGDPVKHLQTSKTENKDFSGQQEPASNSSATLSQSAGYAFNLISHLILSKPEAERPVVVLIERQRWRTMGGAAIQQWTVRVNTFEAMLWAILKTLQEQGLWNGQIISIDPAKVATWWVGKKPKSGANTESLKAPKQKKVAEGKKAKIEIVQRWLNEKNIVEIDKTLVQDEAGAYNVLLGKERKTRKKKEAPQETKTKKDDLADCLLQGIAWSQWEENSQQLNDEGYESLLKKNEAKLLEFL
jgi:cruciform cutting endonuclease 1